jgi:hypothetical protein
MKKKPYFSKKAFVEYLTKKKIEYLTKKKKKPYFSKKAFVEYLTKKELFILRDRVLENELSDGKEKDWYYIIDGKELRRAPALLGLFYQVKDSNFRHYTFINKKWIEWR